jgi:hypothetical protein
MRGICSVGISVSGPSATRASSMVRNVTRSRPISAYKPNNSNKNLPIIVSVQVSGPATAGWPHKTLVFLSSTLKGGGETGSAVIELSNRQPRSSRVDDAELSWPKGKREREKTDEQKAEAEAGETRRLMRFQTWSSPGGRRCFRRCRGIAVGSDLPRFKLNSEQQKLTPCAIHKQCSLNHSKKLSQSNTRLIQPCSHGLRSSQSLSESALEEITDKSRSRPKTMNEVSSQEHAVSVLKKTLLATNVMPMPAPVWMLLTHCHSCPICSSMDRLVQAKLRPFSH